jgi:hypothetical protein
MDFKKTCNSVTRKLLYNIVILIDFHILMKLVRLIQLCLNEAYVTGRDSKTFSIQSDVKHPEVLSQFLFEFCFRIRH